MLIGPSNKFYFFRTLSIDCEEAQQMVVAQMNEWENNPCPDPVDGKPNGQKCKYKVQKNYHHFQRHRNLA